VAEPTGQTAPMGQKTKYKDGFFEMIFMNLFARKMEKFASSAGKRKQENDGWFKYDYERFVDVSKRVMQGRSRPQQQQVVREVSWCPSSVQKIVSANKMGCRVQCSPDCAVFPLACWTF
ncbi:hypothetical protein BVRB_018700, partial [Beta vulgaris subsp. vulgaris]